MSSVVTALRFTGPGQFVVGPVDRPTTAAGEVLVAPSFVGICATDVEFLDGTHPYLAGGQATYPLQPGHEWSGVVTQSADPLFPPGTRVVGDPEVPCGRADCEFCPRHRIPWCPDRREIGCRLGLAGAAATLVSLPAASLRRIPDGVDDRAAVLAEPALTVLGGLGRVDDLEGRRILVVGAGTIGIIAAQVGVARGAVVDVLETSSIRRDVVQRSVPVTATYASEPPARYDLVICAAGSPAAFGAALRAVGNGGDLLLLGVPGPPVPTVDVASILHRDMTIHGVLCYSSSGPQTMERALGLIDAGVIDASALIDRVYPLDAAGEALERARASDRPHPKVLLSIDEAR
jgi:2-desacetyl-2-hydroxyethyl bacteriochlorophyllide A dehydrogenase